MIEENEIKQISYELEGIVFNMRLAPSAEFPILIDDKKRESVNKFYIAETATTYELYYKVLIWAEANGYKFANQGVEGNDETEEKEGIITEVAAEPTANKRHPVTRINWRDCLVWCNALTEYYNSLHDEKLALVYSYQGEVLRDATIFKEYECENIVQNKANGFRLAQKKEWEMAARYIGPHRPTVGSLARRAILINDIYWTPGNYASGATASYHNEKASKEVAWYDYNTMSTQEVGLKRPNALGLYDMSGNVWEWTFFIRKIFRGCCGGCWDMFDYFIQVGHYCSFEPTDLYGNPGFRIARTP